MGGRGGGGPAGPSSPASPASPAVSTLSQQEAFELRVAETMESIRLSRTGVRRDPDSALIHVADLRDNMSDLPRETFNAQLKKMILSRGKLMAMPQSNQKILTNRQREGALNLGNEIKHMIRLLPGGRELLRRSR
jgi:hypothetical protein